MARKLKPLAPIPVEIGVKRRLSRQNDPNVAQADAEFERQRMGILKRDGWTCRGQGCGFASTQMEKAPAGGMEVHHIDDDHHNNDPTNLATLCPFCHMAFTAGRRGAVFAGSLGLLPGISQGELNRVIHTIWGMGRAMEMVTEEPETARRLGWKEQDIPRSFSAALREAHGSLTNLMVSAEADLDKELGGRLPEITNPEALYAVLQGLPQKDYERRGLILRHVRLLPHMEPFSGPLDLWAEHVWLRRYPPTIWEELVRTVGERMAEATRESA